MFDKFVGLIKDTLSNPFKIVGAGIALSCEKSIFLEKPFSYSLCASTKIISFVGVMLQEVTSLFEGDIFKIKDDYCDRLEPEEGESEESGGFFG